MSSCDECVFLVSRKEIAATGDDPGVDVCGAGVGPVSFPTIKVRQEKNLKEHLASTCGRFASEPTAPGVSGKLTALPLHGAKVYEFDGKSRAEAARSEVATLDSCLACQFYIPPEDMLSESGMPIAVCAAKGTLLQRRGLRAAANGCKLAHIGARDGAAASRLRLNELYTTGLTGIGTLTEEDDVERSTKEIVEPTTYPTDKEVTPEETALGIRAWRKIVDPQNADRFTHLPVFDPNFFSDDERAGIPRSGDDEHPEEYVDHMGLTYKAAVLWMHLGETPALWGVAGTGKTEFYRYMAWLMCLPFHRISVTGSTEVEDLAGKMHFKEGMGTYFTYGRIPTAWMKPGVICLDEPNVGMPEVWQFIRPLTDNSKQLVLDMNNGERISRHPHAFLGMAMNPAWDIRNSGTASLADADGSRLSHIYVEMPDADTERKIIADRVRIDGWEISEAQLDMVMGIAKDLRDLCENDTLPITWGIRPQIKVSRALRWFEPQQAYRLATADYLEPSQQTAVMDVVKAHAITARAGAEKRTKVGLRYSTKADATIPPALRAARDAALSGKRPLVAPTVPALPDALKPAFGGTMPTVTRSWTDSSADEIADDLYRASRPTSRTGYRTRYEEDIPKIDLGEVPF